VGCRPPIDRNEQVSTVTPQSDEVDFDLTHWIEPSGVRMASVPSVDEFLEDLRRRYCSSHEGSRFVSIAFDRLPAIEPLIDKGLTGLAGVALALWPDWYDGAIPFSAINESTFAFEDRFSEALSEAGPLRQAASVSWVKAARDRCRTGRTPLPPGLPRTVQAAQLALAIAPRDLLIVLAVVGREQSEGRLLGLARSAEWLGRTTEARVLVVVPTPLSRSSELESISYEAIPALSVSAPSPPGSGESRLVDVGPIIGRPHPYSPGEQLLASRLVADEMLGGLFRFNVRVETTLDSRFLVDLLWPEGRLVVEVDGYEYHSNRLAFSLDRRRDYELLVSGYLVLRLPHDEVMDDVEVAIEKIRDLVRFRRSMDGTLS
jgi:very-short-patch-repair endonuclease